jgi:hypothetical protein
MTRGRLTHVRGSNAGGTPLTRNAHSDAKKHTGATERRIVDDIHVQVIRAQRGKGGTPVYRAHVSCVKRRVNEGPTEILNLLSHASTDGDLSSSTSSKAAAKQSSERSWAIHVPPPLDKACSG